MAIVRRETKKAVDPLQRSKIDGLTAGSLRQGLTVTEPDTLAVSMVAVAVTRVDVATVVVWRVTVTLDDPAGTVTVDGGLTRTEPLVG